MKLRSALVYNSAGVLVRAISLFVLNKLIAVYLGPAGLPPIGQLQNVLQVLYSLAGGALTNGVVRYSAEYTELKLGLNRFKYTILFISTALSLISSVVLLVFSGQISSIVFGDGQYWLVFWGVAASLVFQSWTLIYLAYLNGLGRVRDYFMITMISNFSMLLIVGVGITQNLEISLFLLGIYPIVFFPYLIVRNFHFVKFMLNFRQMIDWLLVKNIFHYAAMAISSAILGPLAISFIRSSLLDQFDVVSVGYWEGVTRLSSTYLLFITTLVSFYFLPIFSRQKTRVDLLRLLWKSIFSVGLVTSIIVVFIYIFKVSLIKLIFTEEFLPMIGMMKWQLIGDVLKAISWVVAYALVAKKLTASYIFCEVFFSATLVVLSVYLTGRNGLEAITVASAVNNAAYLVAMIFLIMKNRDGYERA